MSNTTSTINRTFNLSAFGGVIKRTITTKQSKLLKSAYGCHF